MSPAQVLEELVAAVKQPGFLHMLESAASSFMPRSRSRTSLPRTRSGGSGVGPVTPPPPAAPPAQPADYHPLQASLARSTAAGSLERSLLAHLQAFAAPTACAAQTDASDSEAEDAEGGQRPVPRSADGSASSRASPAPSHAAPSQAPSDADAAAGAGEAGEPPLAPPTQRRNADGEFVMVDKDEAREVRPAQEALVAHCASGCGR